MTRQEVELKDACDQWLAPSCASTGDDSRAMGPDDIITRAHLRDNAYLVLTHKGGVDTRVVKEEYRVPLGRELKNMNIEGKTLREAGSTRFYVV